MSFSSPSTNPLPAGIKLPRIVGRSSTDLRATVDKLQTRIAQLERALVTSQSKERDLAFQLRIAERHSELAKRRRQRSKDFRSLTAADCRTLERIADEAATRHGIPAAALLGHVRGPGITDARRAFCAAAVAAGFTQVKIGAFWGGRTAGSVACILAYRPKVAS